MAPVAFSIFANAPTVSDISNSPVILGPNITGENGTNWSTLGAFYKISASNSFGSSERNAAKVGFDASLESDIYGKSTIIQPNSAHSLIIIKE